MAGAVIAKAYMNYNHGPLIEGQFLKRYKRFFADVQIGSQIVVAHVPNTGSLKGICDNPPRLCRVEQDNNPKRKLQYTLMQVQTETSWVGVNTHLANTLVFEAWQKKQIPTWHKFTDAQREVKISPETRLDLLLTNGEHKHFIEIKSVTLADKNCALFPDAVTERGQKHLRELMNLLGPKTTCEIVFVIQREDCNEFSAAESIDPEYAQLLSQARAAGVQISAYPVTLQRDQVALNPQQQIKIVCR